MVEGIGNVARRCLFAVFDGHGPSGNQASVRYATLGRELPRSAQPTQRSLRASGAAPALQDLPALARAPCLAQAFARDLLPDVLVNDRRFRDQPVAAMAAAFPKLHRKYLAAR